MRTLRVPAAHSRKRERERGLYSCAKRRAPATILHHNAHFRDNGCRFGPPLTLFLSFDLLHRVDHVTVFLSASPQQHPLFTLQAQNIASPKWLPTTYAPGLSKTAACAAYCMDRFNYKYGPPSYFLLASSLL